MGITEPVVEKGGARPRSPGVVYGVIALVLLVVVTTLALTAAQPPPPTVAEFAPQAVEQIEDAPEEQSSEFGSAPGAGTAGEARLPTPEPGEIVVVEQERVRRCVGDPPRQIEDPQSPPCVPYWEGDNGGSTYQGVTDNEIRIMIPTPESRVDWYQALERFFNSRFEFYGRKLTFVYHPDTTKNGTNGTADQQADAAQADDDFQVFASASFRTAQGFYYHRELARRRIVSATGTRGITAERAELGSLAPYLWSYVPETEFVLSNTGEWACARLAGRRAVHAGQADLQGEDRVFGIILQPYYDGDDLSAAPLEDALAGCDASSALTLHTPVRSDAQGETTQAGANDPVSASNAILQMSQAEVSSIFCLCMPYAAGALMRAATNQNYFPEWILGHYGMLDQNFAVIGLAQAPLDQMANALGITFAPRQHRPSDEPWMWATKEGDPNYSRNTGTSEAGLRQQAYRGLLLLASGIQMAGPILTPETFAAGLHATTFPNPNHPINAGAVGFEPSRFAMTMDAAEMWWSSTEPDPYGQVGTWCYVDGGRRLGPGSWPKGDDAFFDGPCDSGA